MCEVSFFEVLDEQVVDLLQPDKSIQNLGNISTVSVATEADASVMLLPRVHASQQYSFGMLMYNMTK